MGLFKRAHVQGVNHELIRQGVIAYPSKEAADEVADAVADGMPEEPTGDLPGTGPEVSPPEGHSPEEVAAVANKLIEIANQLMAQAGAGGPPAAAAAKMGAETLYKTASAVDTDDSYADVASKVAVELMEKVAAETKYAGNLIQGGDKGNTPSQAARVTEMGELDQAQRPEGTYSVPQGVSAMPTMQGHVGSLENADRPSASPAGSNSLTTDANKQAALAGIRKLAGSLIQGGDKGNTPGQAAAVTEMGALDLKQRPEGYAKVQPGGANFSEPQAARIGLEKTPDVTPGRTISGTNSVIEASKAAAFMDLFRKTAAEVVPWLPEQLNDDQKVAAVRHMMGMDPNERLAYVTSVKAAADEVDPATAVKALKCDEEEKDEDEEEKDEEKSEKSEKSEESEKKGSLLSEIRKIAKTNMR